jgi:hypothetical protein
MEKDLTEFLMPPAIDAVYTWVNGSDPRQIEGSLNELSLV